MNGCGISYGYGLNVGTVVLKKPSRNASVLNFGYTTEEGQSFILDRHDKTKVCKFVKIKANASIYDGNLVYFAERLSLSNPRIKNLRNLIVKQKYSCFHCGLLMLPGEVIELHHLLDKYNERTGEIRFVHGHCHDYIHSTN